MTIMLTIIVQQDATMQLIIFL